MMTKNLKSGWTFAAGFTAACVLFLCSAAAVPNKLNQSSGYDAVFNFTGKSLLLEIVDHDTNTLYLYNRMDKETYELKESIDLSQTGRQEIKISERE